MFYGCGWELMRKLDTVTHQGSKLTLSMIKWGVLRRAALARIGQGAGSPALFIPRYEIAIYEGSQSVVFSQRPTMLFYYPDEETALEKWDELVGIVKVGGLYAISEFIRNGDPRKQGFLTNFRSV